MKKIADWLDIIFDFLGCGLVLVMGLFIVAGVVKFGGLLWPRS